MRPVPAGRVARRVRWANVAKVPRSRLHDTPGSAELLGRNHRGSLRLMTSAPPPVSHLPAAAVQEGQDEQDLSSARGGCRRDLVQRMLRLPSTVQAAPRGGSAGAHVRPGASVLPELALWRLRQLWLWHVGRLRRLRIGLRADGRATDYVRQPRSPARPVGPRRRIADQMGCVAARGVC